MNAMNRCMLLLFLSSSSCALSLEENRPLLRALDGVFPETEGPLETVALGIAISPVAIPAGLGDALLVHPVLEVPGAASRTYENVWQDPQGAAFYQSALIVPKVAVTPVLFILDWLWHCLIAVEE